MNKYFPFLCRLKGSDILIIGGGKEAEGKAQKLMLFEPNITFIKEKIPHIEALFSNAFPKAVIVTDKSLVDIDKLYDFCVKNRIEINTADDKAHSTFIFPALICRDKLTVAVSTNGASPASAVKIKKRIEEALPDSVDEILDWLSALRNTLKHREDIDQSRLPHIFRALADAAFEKNRPLELSEAEDIIAKM